MSINECVKGQYFSTDLERIWKFLFGGLTSGEKAALECARKVSEETHEDYRVEKDIKIMSECDVYGCGGASLEYYQVVKGTRKSR